MEFFFLTENNRAEIAILILLAIILIYIWGYDLYQWIGRVRVALGGSVRWWTTITTPVFTRADSTIISVSSSPVAIDAIETPIEWEKIDTSKVEKLVGLVSSIRTLIARGMISEARVLIIEGLSLSKNHRDLNLLLAQIYEWDGQYEKAEYIYKDMAELHSNDIEILEKLANVLIVEKKYQIASEIYKKIHASIGNTETILYMLTHISNTLGDSESTLHYAKQYVLQWPKNPEIISLLATVQVTLGLRRDAIETYKNLKNLTPYSHETTETLQKLLLEEELANNFASTEK